MAPPAQAASGTTTREQQRRNNAELDAIDDCEKAKNSQNQNQKRTNDIFKGKVDKMDGNVFQLAEENRKGNQLTQSMEAKQSYATIKLEHAKDLAPLFQVPVRAAKIPVPADQPPMSADNVNCVTRDHRSYIAWKFDCENCNTRTVALQLNLNKLFPVIILHCSQSVKSKLESSVGYETAKLNDNCEWLITTLRNICHNATFATNLNTPRTVLLRL